MNKLELTTSLSQLINSKIASTYFINGPVGSGKKHVLSELAVSMPSAIPSLVVLGPYQSSKVSVVTNILNDMFEMQFLTGEVPDGIDLDWNSAWFWLQNNIKTSRRLNLLVLVNIDDIPINDYEQWRVWLSGPRYLEHFWDNKLIHVLILISGNWDQRGLEDFYRSIQLSFPYTVGQNQSIWSQISQEDAIGIVKREFPENPLVESYGKLLFELTGGHPGAIKDILSNLPRDNVSSKEIIQATHRAAMSGIFGDGLIKSWGILSSTEIGILKDLVLYKKLPKGTNSTNLEVLHNLGIIEYKNLFNHRIVNLKSWYIHLLTKYHAKSLGLADVSWGKFDFEEFMPTIPEWNIEAYRILNDIENQIRNFAVSCLFEEEQNEEHILSNHVLKRIRSSTT